VPESLTTDNPALKGKPDYDVPGAPGVDEEEKKDYFRREPGKRAATTPRGDVVKASAKINTGQTFERLKNIFESVKPDSYPEIKTEDEFAEGGSVETPKRGLVDEPGSYGGERAIPRKYVDGIMVSETLDGKKTYYAKVKVGDETKSFSDSSLEKVKKWKEKNSAIARKKGYKKVEKKRAAIVAEAKKENIKLAKKTAKARANIDKWTKNWLNKNLNKYDVRELDLFKKELVEDWAKQLKKNPNLYEGKVDFKPTAFQERTMTTKNLPNLTGSSISDKPFKYGPRVVGDKLTIETTLNKIFYDNQLKDKNFKNKVKNYMQHFIDGKPHGNNVVARNAYDSKTAKLLDDDVLYLLSAADSKLIGSAKRAVLVNALGNVYTDYREVTNKMGENYLKNSKLIDEFLGGKNLIAKASVREHNALKKIFDVSELPLTLRYNIDHMYGISEAAREITNPNSSKARVKAILNNTMGMTQKRNFMLGTEGYSFRRKSLINKINAGKNVDANLLKLNEATKAAYNVDNAYGIKQGKATPNKSFVGQTRKERFQSYFQEIYKTPEGKKQIIKQAGSLENLLKKLPKNSQINLCRKLNVKSVGDLVKGCPTLIAEKPNQTLSLIEQEAKKIPKETGDEVLKAANKIRQGLKVTGLGLLTEVPFELAAGVNPYKRGKPMDEIVDESILGLYGIGRDLNRPNVEEFVNTTQRAGALKTYDYYKDQNRLKEIDTTLKRLSVDQPDADTSDLLREKELIQGRLGTEPTNQDVDDFEIFLKRRAGEFEANKKARGQYGPFTNIIQGTTPQSFSDAAEELNIDLGGILGDLVLPEREDIVPRTTRKQRRDRDFMRQRAEGIKQLEQNILFPATGSSFAGGGIAKLAGKSSGTPPTSGPNSGGLPSIRKNDMRIQE